MDSFAKNFHELSIELQETTWHLSKCKHCRRKLDLAEFAIAARNAHPAGSIELARKLCPIFVDLKNRAPTLNVLYRFVKSLKSYLQDPRIVNDVQQIDNRHCCQIVSMHLQILNEDNKCSVCLEKLRFGRRILKPSDCSHQFHPGCLVKWLHFKKNCPYCWTEISVFPWCAR